jgi:4-hydroxy-tetrahydrodipicolinate reductase
MARRVLALAPQSENVEVLGLVSRSKPKDTIPMDWYASLEEFTGEIDLLIDFTLPAGTTAAADWCARHGVALLTGTTGLSVEERRALKTAAQKVPVLWAPNLSFGVAVATSLVRRAASAFGASANIHIAETHHEHKLDAPSGTALALAEAVMEGRCEPLEDLLKSAQQEKPIEQGEGELTFSSVREGEVIGEHTVSFRLADEEIEITHKALNRDVFAKGALKAGEWLAGQPAGYYSTSDWLDLG